MKRSYPQMLKEQRALNEQIAALGEKRDALDKEIKARPEYAKAQKARKAAALLAHLPPLVHQTLCSDAAETQFPEFGRLEDLKISWEEAAMELKDNYYADLLRAEMKFEKKKYAETEELNTDTGSDWSIWDMRWDDAKKQHAWTEDTDDLTLPVLWQRCLAAGKENPVGALWLLIQFSYSRFLNEESGDKSAVSDDLIVEANWPVE